MMFLYLLLLNNSRNTYSRHLKFGMVIVILFTSPNKQYYVILLCCKVIDDLSLLLFRHITSFSCQIKLCDYVKITSSWSALYSVIFELKQFTSQTELKKFKLLKTSMNFFILL